MRVTTFRIHKWLGIALGLLLALWGLTAVLLISIPHPVPSSTPPVDRWDEALISPAEAVKVPQNQRGIPLDAIAALSLRNLGARLVWVVWIRGMEPTLVDARSGSVWEWDPVEVGEVVQASRGRRVTSVEEITAPDLLYSGPLPVYRATLDDGTPVHLNPRSGSVEEAPAPAVARLTTLADWHTFAALSSLPGGVRSQLLALWATGALATVLIGTGYWLWWCRRPRQGTSGRLRRWHYLHRVVGAGTGVVFALWILSGMVALLPGPSATPGGRQPQSYESYGISPSEAGRRASVEREVRASSIRMTLLRNELVYLVSFPEGDPVLVSANQGAILKLTPALATLVAEDLFQTPPPVRRVDTVTHAGEWQSVGVLPAYRVVFDDAVGTITYVNAHTGAVTRTTRLGRLVRLAAVIHELTPVLELPGGQVLRSLIIWISTGVLIFEVALGYVLVLRPHPPIVRQGRSS